MSARVDFCEGGRIALGSLRANRMRTGLTTIGIGIGVATLLAIVGIIQGLNESFATQLASLGSSTIYASKMPWIMKNDWWAYRNRKNLSPQDVDAIRAQLPSAVAVAPMVQRMNDVSFMAEQVSNVGVIGTTSEYLQTSGFDITAGRFLSETDSENVRKVAIIGADVKDALFANSNPVGATIRIDNQPFTVIGVLSRKGKLLDNSQDLIAVIPFKTHRRLFGRHRSLSIAILVSAPDEMDRAEEQLVGVLRRSRGTPPEKDDDFSINRPEQLAQTYNQLTGALYGVAMGIGFITLLVGGIGIMNIMLVSVRERTREIGIRRALGARKRTIVIQFLLEASAVSAVGGLLGTLVGLGAARVVSLITPLAATINPLTVLFGVAFAAFVGLLFGIWPAARAASLDPVEALRYE